MLSFLVVPRTFLPIHHSRRLNLSVWSGPTLSIHCCHMPWQFRLDQVSWSFSLATWTMNVSERQPSLATCSYNAKCSVMSFGTPTQEHRTGSVQLLRYTW